MSKHYVDIRVHFSKEQEFEDEDPYFSLKSFERIKVKNLSEGDLNSLGESFAQMDSYQLALTNELPYTLYSGNITTP